MQMPEAVQTSLKVAVVGLVVAGLYFGKEVLVPFALAVLLGFVLDAPVSWLRRWRVSRGVAVAIVISVAVLLAGTATTLVLSQFSHVGEQLPRYQQTIRKKFRAMREGVVGNGSLSSAASVVDTVEREVAATTRAIAGPAAKKDEPLSVRVMVAEPTPMQALRDRIAPMLGPLGTSSIVIVLLVFFLLDRQDLRDRLLRLVGGNLHLMTDALGESARRVSRYLSMQVMINAGYGVVLAGGLWAIGIPGALFWGGLGAVLRFVPYVGPVAASLCPLVVAFGVDPGWAMVGWTLALVVLLELVVNNVLEPWLFGASTGVAPVALLLSAIFWAALWGPVGLILATPLTVCLVVMGRHLPAFHFLYLLLGSDPVFDRPTRLYQRLLAGNLAEAHELAEQDIAAEGLTGFYSGMAVPALGMAVSDRRRASRARHRHRVITGAESLLLQLRAEESEPFAHGPQVLCIGLRWEADGLSADMLAHALRHDGIHAQSLPPSSVSGGQVSTLDFDGVEAVCIVTYETDEDDLIREACRRLRALAPNVVVALALWDADGLSSAAASTQRLGVDLVAATLTEATQRILARLPARADALDRAPTIPDAETGAQTDTAEICRQLNVHLPALGRRAAQRASEIFDTAQGVIFWSDGRSQQWRADGAIEAPRTIDALGHSLVRHVLDSGETLVVPDLERDPRVPTPTSASVTALKFMAAAPLIWEPGTTIGALCILDPVARQLDRREVRLLEALATDLVEQLRAACPAPAQPDSAPMGDAPTGAVTAPA